MNSQTNKSQSESEAVGTMDLEQYCREVASRAHDARPAVAGLSGATKNDWLNDVADAIDANHRLLLEANETDVERADDFGLTSAQVDRLRLDPLRLKDIADSIRSVASLADPVGETIEASIRPNGLRVARVRVPLGVVFFIYESRPNVTVDAAAICLKSGNPVILRGGKEAASSSEAFVRLMQDRARAHGIPEDAIQLVEPSDRAAVGHFLQLDQFIDLAIPRGGESLIRTVAEKATMPVMKHESGNCHVYVDSHAEMDTAIQIVLDSKCQRTGVCNACESLLVHQQHAESLLPKLLAILSKHGVEIRGDSVTVSQYPTAHAATETDYSAEYLDSIISVKVVESIEAAIEHINRFGSHHTDVIVTDDLNRAHLFTDGVDSSAVLVNASTRFNDGGQLGLGAEIGISTDRFHARGPCGLRELTTYKFVCHGNGHLRGEWNSSS